MENKALETFEGGRISWINELMSKCGVISSEQPVQQHTRIVTDAKKREYPFHKIDRTESRRAEALPSDDHPTEYIRYIDTRPDSSFFTNRLSRFVRNMDSDDYRCKVVKHGIVKELVIFQKGSRLFRRRKKTAPDGHQRKGEGDRRYPASRLAVSGRGERR